MICMCQDCPTSGLTLYKIMLPINIMVTKNLHLGPTELRLLLELEKEERRIFDTGDANRILGTGRDSVNTALYRLGRKGRVKRIERGKYILVPARAGYDGGWAEAPLLIASRLTKPYYIGFASALNHWGMTEQVPRSTYIATTKRKRRTEHASLRFVFVTLTEDHFFGSTEVAIDGMSVRVSDMEKTIVDCLLHPEYCGGLDEVSKGLWESWEDLDKAKLLEYAERTGVGTVKRRLLYLLDVLKLNDAATEDALKGVQGMNGRVWLDPTWGRTALRISKKYNLIINRSSESLTRWRGY